MAYREFQTEPFYKAPKIEFFPKTTATLLTLLQTGMQQRMQRQRQNIQLAATYKADQLSSKFTTDQAELNHLSNANTQSAVRDFRELGNLSPSTRERLSRAQGYKALSDSQWQMKEDTEKNINDRVIKGPKSGANYYDKSYDAQNLVDAAYGKEGEDVTWETRGDNIQKVSSNIGKNLIFGFNKEAFLNDYVEEKKTETRGKDSKGISGVKVGSKVTAVFLDKDGVPKVTDEHAIQFLDSSPDIRERYKQEVDLELMDDAKKMAATKEGRDWLNTLPPGTNIAQVFREHPELNTQSKITPGERERTLARTDLEKKQRVSLDNSYDASGHDPDAVKGITSKVYTVAPSFDRTAVGGSGGKFTSKSGDKTGMMISLKGKAYDINEGRNTGNDRSSRDAVIKSYNLALVNKSGIPFNIPAQTPQEFAKAISDMKPEEFFPLQLKTVIKGQAFNRADVLSQARVERDKLAVTANKSAEQEAQQKSLANVIEMASVNPDLEPEIIQAALKSVLGTVVEDIVKVVEPKDPETIDIQNKLGTFNITDKKHWSDDDKLIADTYEKKRKEVDAYVASLEPPSTLKPPFDKKEKKGAPIKSDGSDVDAWTPGNTYTVSNKTYYFDKKEEQWKVK